ncbi:MAG: Asp-tRNA(Asn)/Glu-tRNA(Gln) amidotransferase subunit GatA [Planctomycetia bacterium]|jgi:aspartyl-tRNA(Asn)/glutamyl-tRNA(Gln) amidotransferase subunit A
MPLFELTATEQLAKLESSEITAAELTQAYLDRIEKLDPTIHAFLHVDAEGALTKARQVDADRAAGKPVGRLAGLPIAIKDLLAAEGKPTTCGSRMLDNFRPPYDATVIRKLKEADAILIGRVNMDEFAMGGSNENSAYGPVCNPWDTDRVPGGSSGGSAAAVAARMASMALGSDTGGSIRAPAGLCGITGMKPTYGRVSRYGLVAFASSLDQIGPMGQTAHDIALLLEVIAGHDPADSTSVDLPVPEYTKTIDQPLDGLRLGVPKEYFGEGLDPEVEAAVREAIRVYESLGATIQEISLPHSKYAIATYYIIAPSEASSNLARYDGVHYGYRTDMQELADELSEERESFDKSGDDEDLNRLDTPLVRMYRKSRSESFGSEVKRRIMLGTYALSAGYYDAYYLKALKVRRLIRQDYDQAFKDVDLIVGPVTPTPAYMLGEKTNDPLSMYLFDLFTAGTNLAGIAGLSIPAGMSSVDLPIGLHLQAPPFEEERLLRAAAMFQAATDWASLKCEV